MTYTAARLGLFAVAFGVVYLFGARSLVAIILAWLISGLASYVLLSKLRDRISANAVRRIESRRDRLAAAAAREDDLPEEHVREADGAPSAEADAKDADGDASADGDAEKRDTGAPTAAREP
ncbi:DUF4229 domain-containing protein [Nocardiopsis quinghaiensis]|uniref:DUF4229 domain-containing protein n=1 Tax=Nocardiopsis quinghaiensis TaxID=464995 RepID=UPI0037445494